MVETPISSLALGLVRSGEITRIALLSTKKGTPNILALEEEPCGTSPSRLEKYKSKDPVIITALSGGEVLVRKLSVKLTKDKDIEAVLDFQAESVLPFKAEEAIANYHVIERSPESSRLSVFGASNHAIEQHLENWETEGWIPESISCEAAALASFSALYSPVKERHYVIHLGEETALCCIVEEGKLIASRSIPGGLLSLYQAYEEEVLPGEEKDAIGTLSTIDFLKTKLKPSLKAELKKLQQSLSQALLSLEKQNKGSRRIADLLMTGPGARFPTLISALNEGLKLHLVDIQNPQETSTLTPYQIHRHALPIGLALEGIPGERSRINFRRGEFRYPHPLKRIKHSIFALLGICLLLALSVYFLGEQWTVNREKELRGDYYNLLTTLRMTPQEVEDLYFKEKLGGRYRSSLSFTPEDLNLSALEKRIRFLQQNMESSPEVFPLRPMIPRVSDLLAWMGTHPKIIRQQEETGETYSAIDIQSFHYNMIKRPDERHRRDPYQIKVDLEFTSPSSQLAREVHDAFVAPNPFIDPQEKVKWAYSRGTYKASFFLKDRTTYPSTSGGT